MSKKNNRKVKCPFCWRDRGEEVFIVKPSKLLEFGAYCPKCCAEVIEEGGKLYVKNLETGEKIPV